jgi:hypothetical protein
MANDKALNVETVIQLREGCARLGELTKTKVRTKDMDTEQAALVNSIGNTMLRHANEFTGAWLAYQQEYAPLVRGVSALLVRAAMQAPKQDEAK